MTTRSQQIRIFLSSPGDVAAEREAVAALVETLNLNQPDGVRIELVRWEEAFYSATGGFQEQIASPADCDLMIVILWSRMGTPLPPDRFARADGAAYRSGTEYEFEAAVAAARADGTPDIFVYRKTAPPALAPGDAAAAAQWDALQAFWSQWFVDGKGHMVAAYHDFPSVDAFEHKVGSHLRQWLRARHQLETAAWPESMGSPFRGLEAFDEEHAPVFFGRRRAVRQAQRRLEQAASRGCPFLLIVGRSGVGKSSFVRAGLLPALRRSEDAGLGDVAVCSLRAEAGIDGLCAGLAGLAGDDAASDALDGLAALAGTDAEAAAAAVGRAFRVDGRGAGAGGSRLVVYLDQFETLFALPAEAQAALSAFVDALVRGGAAQVIATLRSDLYRRFQDNGLLVRLKDDGASFDLLPPEPRDIGDMIRGPALAAGLTFAYDAERDIGLDEVLLRAAGDPDALPLLEFTLDELYKRRAPDEAGQPGRHGMLTFAAYAALGGLEGAIAGRAEAEFAALDRDAQAALPGVLRACVTSAGPRDDRLIAQPVPLRRFPPGSDSRRLIDRFADPDARLLVVVGEGDEPVARLAHEALLTHWPRAVEQLEIDRQLILARARLIEHAARWEQAEGADKDSLLLAAGLPLSEAEAVVARDGDGLPPAVLGFVRASGAAHLSRLEQEAQAAQKRVRRARIVAGVIGALGLTTAVAAVFGFQFWQEAEEQALVAEQQASLAEEQAGLAEERAADAERERAAAERYQELAAEAVYEIVAGVGGLQNLAGVRRDEIARILADADQMLQTIDAVGDRASDTLRYYQALTNWEVGKVSGTLGDVTEALERLALARAQLEPLAGRPDASVEWISSLAEVVMQEALVVMREMEDPSGAAALYREAIALEETLLARFPDDLQVQRQLGAGQMGLGDALWELGDFAGAREAYEADLATSERLYEQFPDEDWTRRDLTISLNRIGTVYAEEGRLEEALAAHRRALPIARALLDAAPYDTSRISDVAHALGLIAAVLRQQRRPAEAIAVLREALELDQQLVDHDPSNLSFRRGLMVDHEKIGLAAWDIGDYDTAREHLVLSQEILEALAAADPSNIQWQRDAIYGLGRQAEMLFDLGEEEEAIALLSEQVERAREMADRHPGLTEPAEVKSYALEALAQALLFTGDVAGALPLYQESVTNMRALVEAQPDNANYLLSLSFALSGVGRAQQWLDDPVAAKEALEASLAIAERLSRQYPDNAELLRTLSMRTVELGWIERALGDFEAMAAAFERDFEIAEMLVAIDPTNLEYQRDMAMSHSTMSDVEVERGDLDAARAHLDAALEIIRNLAAAEGGHVQWQSDLVNVHLWLAANAQQQGDADEMAAFLVEARRLAEATTAADRERVEQYETLLTAENAEPVEDD